MMGMEENNESELFGGRCGRWHCETSNGGRGNHNSSRIWVANMLRRPRDFSGQVANQFAESSGCILLKGSFCFGYLRRTRQALLLSLNHCVIFFEGAGKQGMILFHAGYGNVALGSHCYASTLGAVSLTLQGNHALCRTRR